MQLLLERLLLLTLLGRTLLLMLLDGLVLFWLFELPSLTRFLAQETHAVLVPPPPSVLYEPRHHLQHVRAACQYDAGNHLRCTHPRQPFHPEVIH